MKAEFLRALLPLVAAIALTSCLPIPHRHIVRAGARFEVRDQAGLAVPGATVNVYEGSVISGTLRRVATARTDIAGSATVARERSWHLIMLFIPDAEAPSVFGWCVEAPGYGALGRPLQDEASQTIQAPLPPAGAPFTCPERLDRYKLEQGWLASPAA